MYHNQYTVTFCRRIGSRRIVRTGTHYNTNNVIDRLFRAMLIVEYNRTNKRVLKIEAIL